MLFLAFLSVLSALASCVPLDPGVVDPRAITTTTKKSTTTSKKATAKVVAVTTSTTKKTTSTAKTTSTTKKITTTSSSAKSTTSSKPTTTSTSSKITTTSKATTTSTSFKPTTSITTTKPTTSSTSSKPTTTSPSTKPTTTSTSTTSITSTTTTKPSTTSTSTSSTASASTASVTVSSTTSAGLQLPGCSSTQSQSAASVPTGQALNITVAQLGTTTEANPAFTYKYQRDGGGGGTVNGNNIIIFSDTLVNGFGPITNTMVYSTPGDSTSLYDFGNGGIPNQAIPYMPAESSYTSLGNGQTRVAIWPTTAIANVPGNNMQGIGVTGVWVESVGSIPSYYMYNTLFTVTAGGTPSITRTVPILFGNTSVQYGNFGTFLNPLDDMLYFFANDGSSGLKMAQASASTYNNPSAWNYWNDETQTWQPGQPLAPGTAGNIMDGNYNSGDIFWSPRYQTFMAVYFLSDADDTFYYRYVIPPAPSSTGNSTTTAGGNVTATGTATAPYPITPTSTSTPSSTAVSLTGPWSEQFVLYDTAALTDGGYGFNYGAHVYPLNDPCGNTLTMSITLSDGGTPYFFEASLN